MPQPVTMMFFYIFVISPLFAIAGPYCILRNDVQKNVFKYPAFMAYQGSGEDTLQSGCTLTSCWTLPEDEVSWVKGVPLDDNIWEQDANLYDEDNIVHNTYTAESCASRNVANIPSHANFCEICGDMRTWNFQGALWMCYSPVVLIPLGFVMVVVSKAGANAKEICLQWLGFLIAGFGALSQPVLGVSIGINITACRDSYLAYLKFMQPVAAARVQYGIGGSMFFVGIAGWIYCILYLGVIVLPALGRGKKKDNGPYMSAGAAQGDVEQDVIEVNHVYPEFELEEGLENSQEAVGRLHEEVRE